MLIIIIPYSIYKYKGKWFFFKNRLRWLIVFTKQTFLNQSQVTIMLFKIDRHGIRKWGGNRASWSSLCLCLNLSLSLTEFIFIFQMCWKAESQFEVVDKTVSTSSLKSRDHSIHSLVKKLKKTAEMINKSTADYENYVEYERSSRDSLKAVSTYIQSIQYWSTCSWYMFEACYVK